MAKITFSGNIGKKDAALRTVTVGDKQVSVCDFFVCEDNRTAETSRPVWYKVTLWRAYADKMAQYLTSGRYIRVEGAITKEPHVYPVGNVMKAYCEVTADEILFLDGKGKQDTATPEDAKETEAVSTEETPWD